MRVEIELQGERRTVDVRRDGNRWMVTIDGRAMGADVAEVGGRWSLLLGPPEGEGGEPRIARSYEISIEARGGGDHVVHVDGQAVALSIAEPSHSRRRAPGSPAGAGDSANVVAPMSGRIVKLLVKPGDRVVPKQGVVVIEAMKMENELRAPRAGVVAEVRVTEGASVDAKAILVVLE